MTIANCSISTADDGVVLKTSIRDNGEIAGACERITVKNCDVLSRSCALKVGTESFGVDLFGHPHRSQFRRHGSSDASRQHDGCQHGTKFFDQRNRDHGTNLVLQMHQLELIVRLHREHHADKAARNQNHGDTLNPDVIHARPEITPGRQPGDDPAQHFPGKQEQVAQQTDKIDHSASQAMNNGVSRDRR